MCTHVYIHVESHTQNYPSGMYNKFLCVVSVSNIMFVRACMHCMNVCVVRVHACIVDVCSVFAVCVHVYV